ncbi:MAG: hypothetical protein O3A46_14715, partial [Candidatus Poribacteria bacterium]|nr:hypothetical protein [Candidatus Poribacteria bacterium]
MNTTHPKKTADAADTTSFSRYFFRVLVLGIVLTALNIYWIVAAENRVVYELTDFSFFPTVLFTLFFLTLVNLGVKRSFPKAALTTQELASVYIMISVATALAGHDVIRQLVPMMANGFWFATPENEWSELFHHYFPDWLTVSDLTALEAYYESDDETTFWTARHIAAWAKPFFAWSIFVSVLLFVMLCINIVLRKQWTEHEKLNYPIAQMPIELLGDSKAFFSARLMWVGFAIAFGIELMAGLNRLYPAIPFFEMKYQLGSFFTEKPWNAMGGLSIYVYAFAIGLGYLMPLDLSFSLWFFYLLWKAQFVTFAAMGLPNGDGWAGDFRSGSWLAIGMIALWTSRRQIASVVGGVFGRTARDSEQRDPIYKLAVFGAMVGGAFVLLFWKAAGMSMWMATAYFGMYFLFCIAMTRMRAELGPPTHELHGFHPDNLLTIFVGTRPLGSRNLSLTTLNAWMAYGYRCHPMPHQMEGFKIGQTLGIREKRLIWAMMLAGVVGAFLSIGAHIVLYHEHQFSVWGVGEFGRLASWINNPRSPDILDIQRVSFGFVFTFALAFLKRTFMWWPLYPVGYAVGYGWA